jgi:hypothetical protein
VVWVPGQAGAAYSLGNLALGAGDRVQLSVGGVL